MRSFEAIVYSVLTGALLLSRPSLYAQTDEVTTKRNLLGVWGMSKDRHPDGWGSWNPPYEYLEFKEDGSYVRTYVHKKGNGLIFGHYKVINDSITFFDNIWTNGLTKRTFANSTSKLYILKGNEMELWEDWDRILSRKIKKFGHKKKYRPLTGEETEKLEAVTTTLMNDYSLIKDEEGSR